MSKAKRITRKGRATKAREDAAKGRKLAIAMLRAFERAKDPDVLWADKTWRDKGQQQKNVCLPFILSVSESPKLAEGFASLLTHIIFMLDQGMNEILSAATLTVMEKAGLFDHAAPGEHVEGADHA